MTQREETINEIANGITDGGVGYDPRGNEMSHVTDFVNAHKNVITLVRTQFLVECDKHYGIMRHVTSNEEQIMILKCILEYVLHN